MGMCDFFLTNSLVTLVLMPCLQYELVVGAKVVVAKWVFQLQVLHRMQRLYFLFLGSNLHDAAQMVAQCVRKIC